MRNPFLWVLLVFCILVSAYLTYLGAVSISVGLQHRSQAGSWVAVLAGCSFILAVLWVLFRLVRSVLRALKKSDGLTVR